MISVVWMRIPEFARLLVSSSMDQWMIMMMVNTGWEGIQTIGKSC
jgi:hypothetical protein